MEVGLEVIDGKFEKCKALLRQRGCVFSVSYGIYRKDKHILRTSGNNGVGPHYSIGIEIDGSNENEVYEFIDNFHNDDMYSHIRNLKLRK